jgi:hypothetical protein
MTSAGIKSPATEPEVDLDHCVDRLGALIEREGLELDDVCQLLGRMGPDQDRAVQFLLGQAPTARGSDVRDVLQRLEDHLGVYLGSRALAGRTTRIGRRAADVLGALVGILCFYIVVGGLIEGDSLLLGDSLGAGGLLVFGAVLVMLGLFEALHTSATMLKIADLGGIADRHPRAAALHRHFHTDHGLARFLAGRQMVVVFTVFICSPLSSFPHLSHWPLTDAALPGLLRPFVAVGMPGALFVLWFGQLLPQFVATRHAVRLTDARVVTAAFRLAYLLEAVGFARPGFWLASWDRTSERIPSSPALRWKQSAEELEGFGAIGVIRAWNLTLSGARLSATSTTRLYRGDMSTITDGSSLVPGAPTRLTLDAAASRSEGEALALGPSEYREEVLPSGDRRFHKPLFAAVGSLQHGDTLRLNMNAMFSDDPGRDLVHVDRPQRFVMFRVTPDVMPSIMSPGQLRRYAVGDGLGDLTEIGTPILVEPRWTPDGLPVLEHIVRFPTPNTLYVFDWQVDLDG